MGSRTDFVNYGFNHSLGGVSNATNTSYGGDDFDSRWRFEFSVILVTILSISAFCTIVGNSMVLMVIIRHRGMRTRTNLFLVNLAVADLLVGLFVVPFTIATLIENKWIFGTAMCMLNGWMNSFCLITSFHTLMYISVHKYYSIVRPLGNPLKLSHIITMMAAAWTWAAIGSTLNITVLVVVHKPGTSQCGPRYPNNVRMFIVHGLIQLTVIVLPATILVFCYYRMFMEIRKHSQRMMLTSTVEEKFILSQQKKVALTLFIVLATFVMMALPYHAYATYTTVKKDKEHFSSYINPLAYMFLYLSSMCNPIIYAFRSPAFRQGYKEILCHTSNYVISDESEVGARSRRLSSIISTLRRTSVPECRSSLHYLDNRVLSLQTLEKFKPSKQKSLFKLLRSTRQSTAQSVVHRNGDIIIMKGGKIVSVRRAGEGREGSPFMNRLQNLKETTQTGIGFVSGQGHVMFGLVCDGIDESDADDMLVQNESDDNFSTDSDDIFGRTGSNKFTHNSQMKTDQYVRSVKENGNGQSNANVLSKTNNIVNGDKLSADSVETPESSEDVTSEVDSVNLSSQVVAKAPCFKVSPKEVHSSEVSKDKMSNEDTVKNNNSLLKSTLDKSEAAPVYSEDRGIVIHVDDENDILSVMPLTPHTREILAKSDWNVAQTNARIAQAKTASRTLHGSCSTENLSKKPPFFHRQMSVEFIDTPIELFRSKSNISIKSSAKRQKDESKGYSKKTQTGTSESKSSSKSSCLRSPFSSKKIITQV